MEAGVNDHFQVARRRMVEEQIVRRGIVDVRVIAAMQKIPRHLFVDPGLADQAYGDHPLGIGEGQTISQPYIVALMTSALGLTGGEKILEIGTGCGYQTAILATLAAQVYTIERIKELGLGARRNLRHLGYKNIIIRVGDGSKGWEEASPFDGILIAAGSPEVPKGVARQLASGGKMVVPVGGEDSQHLIVLTRQGSDFSSVDLGGCRFVKLVGRHGWERKERTQFIKRSLV